MSFSVGSLVKARGREWVVLPESEEDLLVVRPLGGMADEITGIYLPLEEVKPAQFDLPDPQLVGDYRSCKLLREALLLSTRFCAGQVYRLIMEAWGNCSQAGTLHWQNTGNCKSLLQ